jgi:hypothetical protein
MKAILLLSLLVFSILTARTQTYGYPNYPTTSTTVSPTITPPLSPAAAQAVRNAEESYRLESRKKATQNADKLILLAGQLKSEMDKTASGTLSADTIKKADEIEKLAHSIKQELKQ